MSIQLMAQKVIGRNPEDALCGFDNEAMQLQSVEQDAQVFLMLLIQLTCYKDIIHVAKHKVKVLNNPVHHRLKCLGHTAQAKRHSQKLPKAKRCDYGRFWNVIRVNRHLMITFHQINFGENRFLANLEEKSLMLGTG